MPAHSIVETADCPAAEQLLLTIGRAGVLSCRAIAARELEELLRLLGPLAERQRTSLKRATDIVLVEDGHLIYWAVLLVDEASRVRDELWATISPMLAAAPAAQQILLSTPAGASGEFHRAWTSGEDWERVQITADQCPRISTEHLAAERIRLGDALYRQEYFGAFVSAPGSVFDAEVLAHMFGDHTEDEPEGAVSILEGRTVDRFLQ